MRKNSLLKNRIIIYFCVLCCALLMFVSVPLNNVVCASTTITLSTGFEQSEGSVPGQQFSNSWLSTGKLNSLMTSYVQNGSAYGHTGFRSLYMHVGTSTSTAFLNLTYPSADYMYSFSFWIKQITYPASGNSVSLGFFNKTYSVGSAIYVLGWNPTDRWCYYDYAGVAHTLVLTSSSGCWFKFGITYVNNQTTQYSVNSTTVDDTPRTILLDGNMKYYHIDQIKIVYTGNTATSYLDDLNLSYSDSFSGGGGTPTGCDMTGYNSKGSLAFSTYAITSNLYLHQLYTIPVTTTIVGVSLRIGYQMYNYISSSPSDYHLVINNFTIGTATDIVVDGTAYDVRWCGISVSLTNSQAEFVFYQSSGKSYNGYYWYAGVCNKQDTPPYGDADNDGTSYSYSFFDIYGNPNVVAYPRDLSYIFYYTTVVINPIPNQNLYDNVTTPYNTYYVGDSVNVGCEVKSFQYTNYLQVWHNGTQEIDNIQGIPYVIPQSNNIVFKPYTVLHTGTYKFSIVRNSITVASKSITVSWNPAKQSNYLVYGIPNPYNAGSNFLVHATYYNPTGGQGLILVGNNQNMQSISDSVFHFYVPSNTSLNYTVQRGLTNYYVILFYSVTTGATTTYYNADSYYERTTSNFPDILTVYPTNYILKNSTDYTIFYFSGSHNVIGYSVDIILNGNINVGDVGLQNSFYNIPSPKLNTAQTYYAELVLVTSNGTIHLGANVTFSISPPTSQQSTDIWSGVFGSYKYVFAFGIIIMFLFMPMTIASRLGMELPMIVNLGTASMGLAFCIASGLVDLWVAFFVSVAMVAGALIIMFGR